MTTERAFDRRLVAILAADIVGFSRLMERDEEGVIRRQADIMAGPFAECIAEGHGRIIKTTGDGALVEFSSAVAAVRAAMAFQHHMTVQESSWPEVLRIRYRIGVNLGDVVMRDGDVWGDGVNLAARLEGLADPGGIAISSAVFEQIVGNLGSEFEDTGDRQVKNIARAIRMYKWTGNPIQQPVMRAVRSRGQKPVVALRAFDVLGRSDDGEMLALACHEAVTATLSNHTGSEVVQDEAQAGYVGIASFQMIGNRYRVIIKCFDTDENKTFGTVRFDGQIEDIFATQDELSSHIATAIRAAITAREVDKRDDGEEADIEHMIGKSGVLLLGADRAEWDVAGKLIDLVLEQEPDNFMALALRAAHLMYEAKCGYRHVSDADARTAYQCLRRSLSLNTHSDFVNVIQSSYNVWVTGDIPAALRDVQRALEINPHFGTGQAMLGLITILNGEYRVGVEAISRVTASLNQNPIYHLVAGSEALGHFALGADERCLDCAHRSLQQQPTFVQSMLHVIAVAQRMGDTGQVARMKDQLLSDHNEFRLEDMRPIPFRDADQWAQYRALLRQAGLPE
ncbi:adenylate/guanylate cyclase domain-containing protein [Tateyamaria sp.]|uniref:adenylate/guanylate cyclase domain-containing protein n=1 Tax=Tateyamaria sp. TaxID=1929288 RepID=UPI003B213CE5